MLFSDRERQAIARGELTLAYRHWKRPQAKAGALHRLAPYGMIRIVDVAEARPADVTSADASRSGFEGRDALIADIEKYSSRYPGNTLYRVEFRFADDADERAVLAGNSFLSGDDIAAVDLKLDRMDARAADGPWTRQTLRLIAEHPARRAGDLADMLGRERLDFKADVRKLKALGLTISLEVGYRLSPRGEAFIAARGLVP